MGSGFFLFSKMMLEVSKKCPAVIGSNKERILYASLVIPKYIVPPHPVPVNTLENSASAL